MDPEITPEVTIETDDFADAFAEFQEPAIAPAAKTEPVVAETAPVVTEAAPVVAEAAPVVTEAAPAVAEAAPAVSDTAAEIAALKAQIEALQKAPVAEVPAPATATPEPAAPVYTVAEQAVIDKYRADWPDIQAGEALVRRAEYRDLIGYVFAQIKPSIDALTEATQSTSSRTQYQDLTALVPDYDVVRDKTLAWVETQPAYLKRAYQEVANSGTAADVADLINRFKKETGYAAPAAPAAAMTTPAATPAVAPVVNAALPPAAAAAVAALKVVKSSRSEAATTVDANDFDGAFAEFAKAK